jgi:glutathione synthase/RimK-type ligase-like ATP-grasp enzyme
MNLYWDRSQKQWFHSFIGRDLTFGGEKQSLPSKNDFTIKDQMAFHLRLKNDHIGPIVGIMCGRSADSTLTGNGLLFKKLQENLLANGGMSFVFAPEDVAESYINGYVYLPTENSWLNAEVPFPDIVYNRIPFRRTEKTPLFFAILKSLQEKGIPYFNPSFIDKYELYLLFHANPILRKYLPDTILTYDKKELFSFIQKHKLVYLKPCLSSKGNGIFRLRLEEDGKIHLQSLIDIVIFENYQEFWQKWNPYLKQKKYLAQESIPFSTHNGHRFDFRILCHRNVDQFIVTGVGIRQSQVQDLTTHLPNGGICQPYELVQTPEHDDFIHKIVQHTGHQLSDKIGYFGEFSIDAGVSQSGQYYIYEVNSKPMSFEEQDIEENKIKHLCRLFHQLSGFV